MYILLLILITANFLVPPGEKGQYKTSFLRDFVDLNVAMWTSNNALTPDEDKEADGLTSNPPQWPLLSVGLRMCGWGEQDIKFFLLGNPFIWWGSFVCIVALVLVFVYYAVRAQRGIKDFKSLGINFLTIGCISTFQTLVTMLGLLERLDSWDGSCITCRSI